MHTHTHTYINTYTNIHTIYIHQCIYICIYIYILCVHIYIYTYTQTYLQHTCIDTVYLRKHYGCSNGSSFTTKHAYTQYTYIFTMTCDTMFTTCSNTIMCMHQLNWCVHSHLCHTHSCIYTIYMQHFC